MKKTFLLLLVLLLPTIILSQQKIVGGVCAEIVETVVSVKSVNSLLKITNTQRNFFITKKDTTLVIKNKKIKISEIRVNYN